MALLRLLGLLCLAALGLQLYFALRIAAMAWIDPQSTSFERSQVWRQYRNKAMCVGVSAGVTMRN